MPLPQKIQQLGQSAHKCGDFPRLFNNPAQQANAGRAQINRTFHVYLELCMQSKHDQLLSGYCKSLKLQPRKQQQTQIIHHGATAASVLAGFYQQRAIVAADIARDEMIAKWRVGAAEGESVFTKGAQVDAAVQMDIQPDGYQYELSYWYDGPDVYVLYHCSPERN